jgi:hypothetical protein
VSSEIEVLSDGESVVAGDRGTIERFLGGAGLLERARELALSKLTGALRAGSDLAEVASGIAEQSAMYLKLTPEGVSHAVLGDPATSASGSR